MQAICRFNTRGLDAPSAQVRDSRDRADPPDCQSLWFAGRLWSWWLWCCGEELFFPRGPRPAEHSSCGRIPDMETLRETMYIIIVLKFGEAHICNSSNGGPRGKYWHKFKADLGYTASSRSTVSEKLWWKSLRSFPAKPDTYLLHNPGNLLYFLVNRRKQGVPIGWLLTTCTTFLTIPKSCRPISR